MTNDRYYDYYGSRAAYRPEYAPRESYGAPRRAQMSYMDAPRAPGYDGYHRMNADYAPRRPQARGGYAQASRRPAQGQRPAGSRPTGSGNARRRTPADARRSSGQGRRPAPNSRRASRGIPLAVKLGAAALVLALLIIGGVKLAGGVKESGVERFVDNIYVNGICLTGKTQEEGTQLIYAMRDERLNATYPLTFQGKTWNFSPTAVNAQMDFDDILEQAWSLGHIGSKADRREIVKGLQAAPMEFTCEPTYDEAALDKYISDIAEEVFVAPVDAEVTLTEDKPLITRASQNGWKLDEEALKATLVGLIQTGKGDLQLPVRETLPMVASDDMEMDMISNIKTDVTFRGFDSRSNVRTALNHFNLFTVYPGDTVSFNDVVGPRTEAMGFRTAPEYAGSKEELGVGGGVCQASTTLYNAMIQAGMTIIERHNHTMTVAYVEPSQDAAVNYGKKDFVFRNDTEHAIYIYTNVTKEYANVKVYGTRPEYKYVLESVIESESKSDVIGYQDDLSGKHVYYTTDTPVLYKEGHGSCRSQGWLVSYDWDTQQEVNRVQISYDVYSAGVNVYWRGIHNPDGTTTTATEPPSQF